MGKPKTLDSFLKRKEASKSEANTPLDRPLATNIDAPVIDEHPSKCPRTQLKEIDATSLEPNIGLRPQIWEFPINLQDEIQHAYIKASLCQPKLSEFPFSSEGKNCRRFQHSWYKKYSTWLEYLKSKDAIFCLQCYVFAKKPTGRP
jgi:hypothetical protein